MHSHTHSLTKGCTFFDGLKASKQTKLSQPQASATKKVAAHSNNLVYEYQKDLTLRTTEDTMKKHTRLKRQKASGGSQRSVNSVFTHSIKFYHEYGHRHNACCLFWLFILCQNMLNKLKITHCLLKPFSNSLIEHFKRNVWKKSMIITLGHLGAKYINGDESTSDSIVDAFENSEFEICPQIELKSIQIFKRLKVGEAIYTSKLNKKALNKLSPILH
jgi:hypothetical protein